MAKKQYSIVVKGKRSTWSFNFYGEEEHLQDWLADGLEIGEICYSIPEWIVSIGLLRQYMFVVDVFNFKNPFK